ncbi:MAG: glycine oxidase ThiO [Thermoanaerobaculia bacterium]
MGGRDPDVLVLGGGLIGLACARELALRGVRVTLLERGAIGREASAAAAGMLAPLSEVRTPGALFEACRASRDRWPSWLAAVTEEAGRGVEYDGSGALITARGRADELAMLDEMESAAATLAEPVEDFPLDELFRLVPDLTRETVRALRLPGEHRVDNVELCRVLRSAVEAGGVEVLEGAGVTRLRRDGEGIRIERTQGGPVRASAAVVATGAWSGGLAGVEPLPVRPVRGQMLRLTGVDWPWNGNVRTLRVRYGIRRGPHDLLFGATLEDVGFEPGPTPAGLSTLLADLAAAFPTLADARICDSWAGWRPGTPDDLPVVGRYRDWPVWIASGHYRNGILLAPWTAETLVPWVIGEADEPSAHAFGWARFAP